MESTNTESYRTHLGGGANAADCDEDVVAHEVCSQALDLVGEGRAEHESLTLRGHVFTLNDATDLSGDRGYATIKLKDRIRHF